MDTKLNTADAAELVAYFIADRRPVLLVGPPGVGKSDLVAQAAEKAGYNVILSHPAVADPTDAKGLPWVSEGHDHATFLPFGELHEALTATEPTVWFLDDLGQAPAAVQASFMQLLLARRVNGHKLPDCVTFVAATNRREDRAGVSGILEPVKSRFATIIHIEASKDKWVEWALGNDIAPEVISYLRFRPEHLSDFKATAEITNSPCPRTWANVSAALKLGMPGRLELPAIAGAIGEGPAGEFYAFLKMYRELPDLDGILLDPHGARVPDDISALYAVSAGLARQVNKDNFDKALIYASRLREEFAVLLIRDAYRRDPSIAQSKAFLDFVYSDLGKLVTGSK